MVTPISSGNESTVPPASDRRADDIRTWTVLPDFASVNWHEAGAGQVAETSLERNIGVEAGLWHSDAVVAWQGQPDHHRCLRVLLEVVGRHSSDDPDGRATGGNAQLAAARAILAQ